MILLLTSKVAVLRPRKIFLQKIEKTLQGSSPNSDCFSAYFQIRLATFGRKQLVVAQWTVQCTSFIAELSPQNFLNSRLITTQNVTFRLPPLERTN